ncbi:MAG: TIGR04283 family arsenosugar biosynthesis glycosyltransferase [Phaeodactylibacter sp.]|uniref:TIGR04283 family arsenosugar biosynthesis glycosyltransferase n=1 Tax=Phaeodactylibacter sp. TaxID=1940289 RepID=UPI0032EAC4C3
MTVSIIIPALDEAGHIGPLVQHLRENADDRVVDILVVDAGSTDGTPEIAAAAGATVLKAPQKGRSRQMNYGAQQSRGAVLYFVHADTLPPASYLDDIAAARSGGYPMGAYQSRFDTDHPLLRINAYFTRFDFLWCRGGDQSIYINRAVFEAMQGYREDYVIMEEYDLLQRARKKYPFKIMPKATLISARKYEENSYMRVQLANLIVFNMYRLGFSQQRLANTYCRLLKYR